MLKLKACYSPKLEYFSSKFGGDRMPIPLAYPDTRHDLAPLVILSDKAERDRLSPAAVRVFLNVMDRWGVPVHRNETPICTYAAIVMAAI